MAVESVLTSATEGILTKLTSLAAQEISVAWGFKSELNRLRETLSTIEGYLADVPQKPQDRGGFLKKWVTNLTRLTQDADNVLDEFNYELLRRKVEIQNHIKKKVLNFFSLSNPVAFRLKIAHKIQKINASLEKLKSEASVIGLLVSKKIDAAPQGIRGRIQTDSFPEKEGIIVGREEVVSNIVTTLTNSNINQENLAVMAIVGMAGLGKTTLAKSIYNDNSIKGYFDPKVWVCVSDPFDVKMILISMLESLSPLKAAVKQSLDALLKHLREQLKGKTCLLVFDDVWNENSEKWNELMNCLLKLESAQGSTIIVTTRSEKVASITETLPRPKLKRLSRDECWSVLKYAACSYGSSDIPLHLESIGRDIAKNCDGLPLMAKVLGGILRSKKTTAEWSKVKDSRIWDLPKGEDRIMSVLKLSFDNLESPALKQCFAYCSVFMKDARMKRDDLIQLWMAQGLLPEKSNLEMEDIGNEYFDILFQSSLFQDAKVDDDGIVIQCKMHDLLHDLAKRVSESRSMMRDFPKIQDAATPSIIERIPEGSSGKLRTLFSNVKALPGNMLPWFKALRVLKLYRAHIKELPVSIGKLKHLRYLDISRTRIKRLPNSIGKLYNLQTLRATNSHLEEFMKDVQNLINLRHVYCNRGTEFPVGVLGRLTSLRTLSHFNVGKEMGSEIEELAALNQLKGDLIIYNLEQVSNGDEARKAKLEEKKNVRGLKFIWSTDLSITNNNNEDVLEGLQPHSKLERLEIDNFMGFKFPSWLIKLENLKQIKLMECTRCEKVPTLGHLPRLTVVWIDTMKNLKCVGAEIYGTNPIYDEATTGIREVVVFPALKELHIHYCKELIEWIEAPEQVTVFPCLEELDIQNCPKLRMVPSHFPSLKKLKIKGNEELTCLPKGMLLKIERMEIRDCMKLTCIAPDVFVCCASLRKLAVDNCPSLQSIPALNLFTSLRKLNINKCERLKSSVSSGLQLPASLVTLEITNAPNLESLPSLDNLTSLCQLVIFNCENLKYLPIGLHCCSSLKTLELGEFWEELDSFPDFHLGTGSSQLQRLALRGWHKLKSLPQQIQHFTSLTSLEINYFNGVEAIEDWLGNLTSLRTLEIYSCPKLMNLPSVTAMQRLTKLQTLEIWLCPLLEERCTKDSGPEWPKISHIPNIKTVTRLQIAPTVTMKKCFNQHWLSA